MTSVTIIVVGGCREEGDNSYDCSPTSEVGKGEWIEVAGVATG